jgi:hypothetical protein
MSSASLAVPYHTNREVTYFLYVCRQRVEGVSFTYLVKGEIIVSCNVEFSGFRYYADETVVIL